ncbi:hypothetical protein GCM10009839_63350 [Catenulispora yoronensis]|uniref:Thioesterase domain-containing protein n=1 Tax=Catenulispora yoronensis TaxID=450799 RepID=A0ABN2V2K4_9ACTN
MHSELEPGTGLELEPEPELEPGTEAEREADAEPHADDLGGSDPGDAGLAAARRMFDADRASAGLGIELVDLAVGRAVVRMRVAGGMLNGHGIGHGGYVFLLADTAFALACNSRGPATVAAGGDISFLAPVAEGDVLTARAEERVVYGRSGIYDVTVVRGEEVSNSGRNRPEIVAEFRGRSRNVARR